MTPLQVFGLAQLGLAVGILFLSLELRAEYRRRTRVEALLRKDVNRLRDWVLGLTRKP